MDIDYLNAHAIPLFDAKGCNANAVAEYVLSCLFVLSEQHGLELGGKSVGLIGCGHVGTRLRHLLRIIGLETRVYDPFIKDQDNRFIFQDLDNVLSSDIITLHVPLTTTGEYPTAKMVERNFLKQLNTDVIFINTARGGVVNEPDLIDFARQNRASHLVLDVWDNEPYINDELVGLSSLATSHIAGYSAAARLNATHRIYEQVRRWFDINLSTAAGILITGESAELNLSGFGRAVDAIRTAVLASYDVRGDCAALRGMREVEPDKRGVFFDSLRMDYPSRREFHELQVTLSADQGLISDKLSALGFSIKTPSK